MFHSLNSTQDQFHQVISKLGNMPLAEGYDVEEVTPPAAGRYMFASSVVLPDGNVLLIPSTGYKFCVYDPQTKQAELTCVAPGGSTGGFWGGVLLRDGTVFCVPTSAEYCCVYDPRLNSARRTGIAVNPKRISNFLIGGILLPDGRVMLVPYDGGYCWIYNPADEALDQIGVKYRSSAFFGGQLLPDGRVMLVPCMHPTIVIFDPASGLFADAAPATGHAGSVVMPNGNLLLTSYITKHSREFNPSDNSLTEIESPVSLASMGKTLSGDGACVVAPRGNMPALVYDSRSRQLGFIDRFPACPEGYADCKTLPDGSVFVTPLCATKLYVIRPRGVTPLPLQTCLSPYLNKF